MSGLQQLNRALLRTLMSPEVANIVADSIEELECENAKLRNAIAAAITEARTLECNTDLLVDDILNPALKQ